MLASACQPNQPSEQTGRADTPTQEIPANSDVAHPVATPFLGTRRYTGQVGSYPVVIELTFGDTLTTGSYYYPRHGQPLELRATRNLLGKPLVLREVVGDSLLATWQVAIAAGPQLRGTWRSADGKRTLPFALREDYRDAVRYAYESYSAQSSQAQDSADCGRTGVNPSLELDVVHLLDSEHRPALQRVQQRLLPAPYGRLQAYVEGQVANGNGNCAETKQQAQVTYNGYQLLSVNLFEAYFEAGADHPRHQMTPSTFDLRTGQQVYLRDLLRPGYEQRLRSLLTKRLQQDALYGDFYQEEGGLPGQPFERWLDKAGRPQTLVPLPHNSFCLTPAGIEFEWGEYEIGPYVIGPQTVEMSFDEMRPMLRSNSALRDVVVRFK
ncbi:RsiV family protein [Hymenobacter sp. GOD-10R]|uniref:RsiV family protein n=1 Tax=Hymenobacter sp. GOD-10R TaxID=3093922 RepID=UPI002D7960EB|nr:RsiV family protein [Hymenobacter sp. GOD-10R]WRQ31563.1 RsiV family protein [Hymenobacter sp. GOD-10R]